jgi:AcrR family transcriptional regulator
LVTDGDASTRAVPARTRAGARRLDTGRDAAIAAAVLEVLGRDGYSGLTMDAVALAAGVGKATIYRRWRTKAELLLSVMDVAGRGAVADPDRGGLRDDLVGVLTAVLDLLAGPSGRSARSLVGAVIEDPALGRAFERGPLAHWNAVWTAVLDRAAGRGEIAPAAATSVAAEVGPAVIALRWLVTGGPLDAAVVDELVDEVVLPLLHRR